MIKAILGKNFQSWKNLKFETTEGITLVDGWNDDDGTSEGSGKSAILNALSWGLYGKLPKDVKIDDVIKFGEKNCGVEIRFDHPIIDRVVRTRKPNDLAMVDINNKEIRGKDMKETQKIIEEFVGLSFEAFCQSIYFAQNYEKKFISASQEDKAKILSEIQDLKPFDKARKEVIALAKNEEQNLSGIKHSVDMSSQRIESIATEIHYEEASFKQALEAHENKIQYMNQQIEQGQSNIKALVKKIEDASKKIGQFASQDSSVEELESNLKSLELAKNNLYDENYDKAYAALQSKVSELQASKGSVDNIIAQKRADERTLEQHKRNAQRTVTVIQKLQGILNNPEEKCPTCGSVTGHVDTSHIEADLAHSVKELEQLDPIIMELQAKIDEPIPDTNDIDQAILQAEASKEELKSNTVREANKIDMARKEIQGQINAKNQEKQDIAILKNTVENDCKQLESLEAAIQTIKDQIKEADTQRPKPNKTKMEELNKKKTGLENDKAIKEDLIKKSELYLSRLSRLKSGFKEVKSYVFNSVLAEINAKANQYLQELFEISARIVMVNENMKIKTDVTLNGQEMSLGLLSGGQNRRFSLAVDLALSDVVLARKGSNLGMLILDEYFKDLSEVSMEKCLEILQKRKGSTVLIEHNSIFKSIVDNTFNVRLTKGTTRVEV